MNGGSSRGVNGRGATTPRATTPTSDASGRWPINGRITPSSTGGTRTPRGARTPTSAGARTPTGHRAQSPSSVSRLSTTGSGSAKKSHPPTRPMRF